MSTQRNIKKFDEGESELPLINDKDPSSESFFVYLHDTEALESESEPFPVDIDLDGLPDLVFRCDEQKAGVGSPNCVQRGTQFF